MKILKFLRSQVDAIGSFDRPARLFLIAVLIDGIAFSAWGLFFNFYILGLGFDRQFLGLVTSFSSVSVLLFGLPLGLLLDRLGSRNSMLLGIGVWVTASILQISTPNPVVILATSFIAFLAGTLYGLSQAPFMMRASTPENRTLLFSLSFGLLTLTGAVGNLFAGQLPDLAGRLLAAPADSAAAYRLVLLVSVLITALMLIPLWLIHEPKAAAKPAAQSAMKKPGLLDSLRAVITRPTTLKLILPNLCIGFGAALLIPYMNLFFREQYGMSDSALGILFGVLSLLTGIGSIIGPRLATDLGGKIRAVVLTQSLSVFFLLLTGFSPWVTVAAIGFLLRGSLMNMAVPLWDAFSMEQTVESEQGTVNSLRSLVWQAGWVIGPYISAVVQTNYGFSPLFIATASLYGLAIVMTWGFFAGQEKPLRAAVIPADETASVIQPIDGFFESEMDLELEAVEFDR
jgi:MFS family permease